jgi:hypothetical protein
MRMRRVLGVTLKARVYAAGKAIRLASMAVIAARMKVYA